jgi:hypothetical protein
MRPLRLISLLPLLAAALAQARPVVISPVDGEDAFVYQFIPNSNFVGPPFGPDPANFNTVLSSGRRLGHDTESYLRFPLAGVSMVSGQQAFLSLWVTNNDPVSPFAPTFGVSPTDAFPVTTNLFTAATTWDVLSVTYNTRPASGALLGSQVISGIDRWVTFDVTNQVLAWVDDPTNNPNNGFKIVQSAIVNDAEGSPVYAVYHSSRNVNRPRLAITARPIPEPTSISLLALSSIPLLRRRGRKG